VPRAHAPLVPDFDIKKKTTDYRVGRMVGSLPDGVCVGLKRTSIFLITPPEGEDDSGAGGRISFAPPPRASAGFLNAFVRVRVWTARG
jgi:hypothetical protein